MLASTLSTEHRDALVARLQAQSGATVSGRPPAPDDGEFQSRVVTVGATGNEQIVAVLQRSMSAALARFDYLRALLIGLAALSLVASIAGSILIARGITRPLNRLAESATRIRQGDYSDRIDVEGTDEIGALASSFNHMREGIAAHEKEILRLAYEDHLTGLPNRALFNDRLQQAARVAQRNASPLTVLIMDLDRFKHINDTLGHAVGDVVLREVGMRLRDALRVSDTVARLGGDEFGGAAADPQRAAHRRCRPQDPRCGSGRPSRGSVRVRGGVASPRQQDGQLEPVPVVVRVQPDRLPSELAVLGQRPAGTPAPLARSRSSRGARTLRPVKSALCRARSCRKAAPDRAAR